jgi:hypothetical protein
MPASYIPSRLDAFYAWADNFAAQATASGTTHGLTAPQVTALTNAISDFHDYYLLYADPVTRTPTVLGQRNDAYAVAVPLIRAAAMIIQAQPTTTSEVRAMYQITIPSGTRTPVPVPTAVPDLSVQQITSGMITLRAKTLGVYGNAKPPGTINTRIYRKTGAVAPTSIDDATFVGILSKRFFVDDVSALASGLQVWYIAVFATATGKVGPESSAITCNISA